MCRSFSVVGCAKVTFLQGALWCYYSCNDIIGHYFAQQVSAGPLKVSVGPTGLLVLQVFADPAGFCWSCRFLRILQVFVDPAGFCWQVEEQREVSWGRLSVFLRYRVSHCDEFVKPHKEYDAIFSVNDDVVVLICFCVCSCSWQYYFVLHNFNKHLCFFMNEDDVSMQMM